MAKIDKTCASSFPVNHYFFNYKIAEGAGHTNLEQYFLAGKNFRSAWHVEVHLAFICFKGL